MPDWSRRRALRAATSAALLGLAGCSAQSGHGSGWSSPPRGRVVENYERRFVRDADGAPVFRVDGESASRADDAAPYLHLTDRADVDALAWGDTPAAETLRAFVAATALEARSVFLHQRTVGTCYEVRLGDVRRTSDSVHVDFCRSRKPADVACRTEDRDTVAAALRLPFPGDEMSGVGLGWRRGCHERPRPLALNGTAPDAGGSP